MNGGSLLAQEPLVNLLKDFPSISNEETVATGLSSRIDRDAATRCSHRGRDNLSLVSRLILEEESTCVVEHDRHASSMNAGGGESQL
jgi:hypothetical protein